MHDEIKSAVSQAAYETMFSHDARSLAFRQCFHKLMKLQKQSTDDY